MSTVYNWLLQESPKEQIEKLMLDNCVEYRIWKPVVITYYDKIKSFGRRCTAKYLATLDESELLFNNGLYKKDKKAEVYTEDFDFYRLVSQIEPNDYLGKDISLLEEALNKRGNNE